MGEQPSPPQLARLCLQAETGEPTIIFSKRELCEDLLPSVLVALDCPVMVGVSLSLPLSFLVL
jgi:hypothetical protein